MLEQQKYEYLRSELKKTRMACKLLHQELDEKLKKPQSYVSKVESGERTLDVLEFLSYCKALGVEPIKWLKKFTDKAQ